MPVAYNYVAGLALKKLYARGPEDFKYYLGGTVKPLRPDVIYDLAKDDGGVMEIMKLVKKALGCKTTILTFGEISQNTLVSMYQVCSKNYPHPEDRRIYKIQIGDGKPKATFDDWCISRKG